MSRRSKSALRGAATEAQPSEQRRRTRWLPTNPPPPVTSTRWSFQKLISLNIGPGRAGLDGDQGSGIGNRGPGRQLTGGGGRRRGGGSRLRRRFVRVAVRTAAEESAPETALTLHGLGRPWRLRLRRDGGGRECARRSGRGGHVGRGRRRRRPRRLGRRRNERH